MDPYAAAFVASRDGLIALAHELSDDEWNRLSPLTPKWRVRDVYGHLCGVSEDLMAGILPSADMHAWTNSHVVRHDNVSKQELLTTWATSGLEEQLNEMFVQVLFDQITHEFDIRYAVGRRGDHDSDGVRRACEFAVKLLKGTRAATITLDNEVVTFEGELPHISLISSHFELLRATTGRRSWNQIAAMKWASDLEYVRELLFGSEFFVPAAFDVIEE